MFTLRGKEYTAQCKSVAGNRISISEWFSDRGNPMKNGFYTIDAVSYTHLDVYKRQSVILAFICVAVKPVNKKMAELCGASKKV